MSAVNFGRMARGDSCLDHVQFALFPAVCTLCGARGEANMDLCDACYADLPWMRSACRHCALPLPDDGICGHCVSALPSPIDRVTAVFQYAAPLDSLIMQLKYGAKLAIGRLLGTFLAEAIVGRSCLPWPEAILPVPLHVKRLRHRGFNQSAEIARPVAVALDIPVDLSSCVRVRHTAEQTSLKADERARNLHEAFGVVRPPQYRHVAIVDDVLTTGSTVDALARSLRVAGVDTIEVWVCARAF